MKIKITTRDEQYFDKHEYRDFYRMESGGDVIFEVMDGEPEDSNLCRDFSDVLNLPLLLERVHEAGKNGEALEFEEERAEF